VDSDIQNVPGSPDLAATILDKIDSSGVVVADVTSVGKVVVSADDEKKLINSNVAIELGYALKAVADRNVLLVFNQHYGSHEELPFDLRHKGGSITFNLPPDSDSKRIAEERKKLKDRFVNALKPYLENAPPTVTPPPETPSTFCKAAYFEKGEVLARAGGSGLDQVTYSYDTDSLCYIRLIPAKPPAESIRLPVLKGAIQYASLLTRGNDRPTDLNSHGAIGVRAGSIPRGGTARIEASTQLFESGEIWSIGPIKSQMPDAPEGTPPFVHSLVLEQVFYDTLRRLIKFAPERLNLLPPWNVELGITGSLHLPFCVIGFDRLLYQYGDIKKNEIFTRMTVKQPEDADQLLLSFFCKVHDSTGTARPAEYCGFPPNRPGSAL
jgi:hypothetical protein